MQVKTIPEGYNSGRAYYVRGESSVCQEAISSLVALSRTARINAEKRTRFERNQLQASARGGAPYARAAQHTSAQCRALNTRWRLKGGFSRMSNGSAMRLSGSASA